MAKKEVKKDNIKVIQLNKYVKPVIREEMGKDWVLNGKQNKFFDDIIDRYNGSPTNSAIINGFTELIYGKGLTIKNAANNASTYASVLSLLPKKEVRKIVSDYKLFGSAAIQIVFSKGKGALRKVAGIYHVPRQYVAPIKFNDEGEIEGYFYSTDWKKANKDSVDYFPKFGTSKEDIEIYLIEPYKAGKFYYSDPDYLAAMQYAQLEEEISNYSISHIQNGLSAGFIINFNNGIPEIEIQDKIEKDVLKKVTGSSAAGTVVIAFNENPDAKATVEAFPQNANHEQWQFWVDEARKQIMVGHRVTSPMLFGIKDNSGLGNNAEELETASKLLYATVISPMQELILDSFSEILKYNGITAELEFKPLIDFKKEDGTVSKEGENVELSSNKIDDVVDDTPALNYLINECGEVINGDEYELIDTLQVTEDQDTNLFELKLNVNLAKTFSSSWKDLSEQDTDLFKVRYKYAPSIVSDNSREFCKKLIAANKVYRKEDIILAGDKVVNPGLGLKGADTYNIWLYKGGVNCRHFWQRQIYLRKNNTKISVNEARAMINEIEPGKRERLPVNEKEVAQTAGTNNNFWKAS